MTANMDERCVGVVHSRAHVAIMKVSAGVYVVLSKPICAYTSRTYGAVVVA